MTVRYHQRAATRKSPPTSASATASSTPARSARPSPAHDLDQQIGQLLIDTLTPLAIEAALTVTAELEHRAAEADALRAAHVERARYHADLARRRYLAVDPANRLVADTLEADWNTALRALNPGPGHLRPGPQARHRATHRRPEDPDPPAGHRPARHLERPRHPSPRAQAHRPAAAHRRHRDPQPRHHHRPHPPARRPAPHPHPPDPANRLPAPQDPAEPSPPRSTELLDHHTHAEIADILNDAA